MNAYVEQIQARKDYEYEKRADNVTIQAALAQIAKTCAHDVIANVMSASNVDAAYINRAERANARFNVYSAEKVVNIAQAIARVAALNHYTRAIFTSALALEAAELAMSHRDAVAACSTECKLSDKAREKIVSKTRYQKAVAANTASTQSSSSLNALQAYHVLSESRDAANAVVYKVNRESHAAQELAKLLELSL